ncbi:MAG: hypothetical protein AB2794_13295 [Candidatus Thiodiazotropha endolucinida]
MKRSLLLTDLDNTLYNFIDYFGPSLRAMVHALSRKYEIDEETLYSELQKVFIKYGSIEYSFTVQELSFYKALADKEKEKAIQLARVAFSRARNKRLQPYAGVVSALVWANHSHIPVIGITNAPVYHAYRRLRQLKIANLFTALAAHKDSNLEGKQWGIRGYNIDIPVYILKREELKPSTKGYEKIIQDQNRLGSYKYYVVGDSIKKDIIPAMSLGVTGIWARYGLAHEEKNMHTAVKVTDWSPQKVKELKEDHSHLGPDHIIDSFDEIREIIPENQISLI